MSKCQIRWCKSGQAGTVTVHENIGDGAWRATICADCAWVLGLTENGETREVGVMEDELPGDVLG